LVDVTWADSIPNLLIGLREGLEAGLIVSILLAATRQLAPAGVADRYERGETRRASAAPIWLGVLAAVMASACFAAVLTLSADLASSQVQDAIGGLLSVLAVGLVTAMIFWMRRTAAGLTAQLRGEVARAAAIGAGALTLTAFLAVGREGLETTLFLWSAARASGTAAGPLAGAATGLAAAVLLCWLLYRRAIRLDVGAFFRRTAYALIVIAAGVLAYGLGDLQDAGLLSGQRWIAFDLTAHVHPGTWWVSLIAGVTDLSPRMTVLQVVAWIAYLAVVIPAFASPAAGRAAAGRADAGHGHASPGHAAHRRSAAARSSAWDRISRRRPWVLAGVIVAVPVLVAGLTIAALPPASAASSTTVTVTRTGCARDWTAASSGTQTFTVDNQSGLPGEINLDDTSGDIVGEIETIGPGTKAPLTATLSGGTYVFKCYMGSQPEMTSAPVKVVATGTPIKGSVVAVKPATVAELTKPNEKYQAYAARQLGDLAQAVAAIQADLRRGDLVAARSEWLTAQMDWERVGASYDSFGDLGLAVDGLPDGLPHGVADKHFTGLHRLEYGLWHGQSATSLLPVAATLASDVDAVRKNLTSADLAGDPANLPVRAHEILEDALRDHLSGLDDEGAGAAFAETYADLQVSKVVLGYLAPLMTTRQPGLPGIAEDQMSILRQALLATRVNGRWESLSSAPRIARERVDGAIGALLETLSAVPDLLEVPPAR
jgi:high-affinity iron transporter